MGVYSEISSYFRFSSKKNNWTVIILCLVAGTTFWFFNALNKNYATNIRYPIRFVYDEDTYQAVSPLPEVLNINLSGVGWDLLRKSLGIKVPPLLVPLEEPSETKKIAGPSLPAIITDQLNDVRLNFVLTDTLFINIDKRTSHKYMLWVDPENISLEKTFEINSPITLNVDSIKLTGPESVLNALPDTIRLIIPDEDIDDPFDDEVLVQLPRQELITRDPPTVRVSFNVAEYVVEQLEAPVVFSNVPEGMDISLADSLVKVAYKKPEQMVTLVPSDSFQIDLDYLRIDVNDSTIKPVLLKAPSYLLDVTVDSSRIKVVFHDGPR